MLLKFFLIHIAAEDDSDDMFKPPKMDSDDDEDDEDDFSPFGGKSGLFSGGTGLFDDDDEVMYLDIFYFGKDDMTISKSVLF